jgi:hypothetical protein
MAPTATTTYQTTGALAAGAAGIRVSIVAVWLMATKGLFDPYRPERHYMRGPGPRWHERHGRSGGAEGVDRSARSMG